MIIGGGNMLEADPIKKDFFYRNKREKTKLNWFCYEYAFGIYDKIRNAAQLKDYRNKYNQEQIVDFCVYYSKKMKESIDLKLKGKTHAVMFYEGYAEVFYPEMNTSQIRQILRVAMEAWDELTGFCVTCPNRCISEMNEYCQMFDMVDEEGYLGCKND
jgi:hypothetical protein